MANAFGLEARRSARQRGYDKQWQKLRAAHLAMHPYCQMCGSKGEHVDHIETIASNPRRRLDPKNLQTLCEQHHSILTNAHDKARLGPDGVPLPSGLVDSQGRHLDPSHPWYDGDATPYLGPGSLKQAAMMGNRRGRKGF